MQIQISAILDRFARNFDVAPRHRTARKGRETRDRTVKNGVVPTSSAPCSAVDSAPPSYP